MCRDNKEHTEEAGLSVMLIVVHERLFNMYLFSTV